MILHLIVPSRHVRALHLFPKTTISTTLTKHFLFHSWWSSPKTGLVTMGLFSISLVIGMVKLWLLSLWECWWLDTTRFLGRIVSLTWAWTLWPFELLSAGIYGRWCSTVCLLAYICPACWSTNVSPWLEVCGLCCKDNVCKLHLQLLGN